MVVLNEDKSIYLTRGDAVTFPVSYEGYTFQPGDVVRFKVYGKKDAKNVVLQKDFGVTEECEEVEISLTSADTKIGEVISKPKDYWYEVELNPFDKADTFIGYGLDGAVVFKLFPEGDDVPEFVVEPEDIPVVDKELDMTSTRPVQNQAIARAVTSLRATAEATADAAVAAGQAVAVERARIDNLVTAETVDDELVDIRVGADGVTYGSAGSSVRGQVSGIYKDLSHLPTFFKAVRTSFDGVGYITLEGSYGTQATASSYILMDVKQGETFLLYGSASTVREPVYFFSGSTLLATITAAEFVSPHLFTVPNGANKMGITLANAYEVKLMQLVNGTGWVTPQMYGAVGDGVHDDTEAFGMLNGKCAYIPEGVYRVSHVTYNDNTRIIGSGMRNTIIQQISGSHTDLIHMSNAYNCLLQDLTLRGNYDESEDDETISLLKISTTAGTDTYSHHSRYSHLDIELASGNGVYVMGKGELTGNNWVMHFDDIRVYQCKRYCLRDESSDNKFSNLYLTNGGLGNLYLNGAGSELFTNVKLDGGGGRLGNNTDATQGALLIGVSSLNISFANLDVQSGYYDNIKLSSCKNIYITGNSNNAGIGVVEGGTCLKLFNVDNSYFNMAFFYVDKKPLRNIYANAACDKCLILYNSLYDGLVESASKTTSIVSFADFAKLLS